MKSGDNTAASVIAMFRSILNPIQIFELSSDGPDAALNLVSKMKSTTCRMLVAGGDGTIAWILEKIVGKNIKPIPEVCILPIGTGNDLSRVLGWGAEPPTNLNAAELCEMVDIHSKVPFFLFVGLAFIPFLFCSIYFRFVTPNQFN